MTKARPAVTILLSTFNGERYLDAQLQSLLQQTHENWRLYWRDDGSTDETVAIMRAFGERLGPERCGESPRSGPHLGASPSFLSLLAENRDAEIIAFADQDDVWLPAKLEAALRALQAAGSGPVLYCARQFLVNEALEGAKLSASHAPAPAFPAALTQNIANGNTLVMNGPAARLVSAMVCPQGGMHDWWSYITVAACGGTILFDNRPQVFYRLHKDNLIGSARPLPARAIAALRRGPLIFMTMMRRHTEALLAEPEMLSPAARRALAIIEAGLYGGLPARVAALAQPDFRRRTLLENLLFGFWFLTDRAKRPAPAPPALADPLPGWTAPESSTAK